jgi:hypothetical protein
MPKRAFAEHYNSFLALPLFERPMARTVIEDLRGNPPIVDYISDPDFVRDVAGMCVSDSLAAPLAMAAGIGR